MMQPRLWHRRLGWHTVPAVVIVLILALRLAVDAGLAALVHFVLPALGFWQALALILLAQFFLFFCKSLFGSR